MVSRRGTNPEGVLVKRPNPERLWSGGGQILRDSGQWLGKGQILKDSGLWLGRGQILRDIGLWLGGGQILRCLWVGVMQLALTHSRLTFLECFS